MVGIYQIRNSVNDKIYVGQSKDIEYRHKVHFRQLRHGKHYNRHLQRAFDAYGEGAFVFSVLEECAEKDLDAREVYWIQNLKATNSKFGYNLNHGGEGNHMKEEVRQRISKSHVGYRHTEEARAKMSRSKKGLTTWNKGVAHKPESIEKMRQARKGKGIGENNPRSSLKTSDVVIIKKRLSSGDRQADIARDFNVDKRVIQGIKAGRTWSHVVVENKEA